MIARLPNTQISIQEQTRREDQIQRERQRQTDRQTEAGRQAGRQTVYRSTCSSQIVTSLITDEISGNVSSEKGHPPVVEYLHSLHTALTHPATPRHIVSISIDVVKCQFAGHELNLHLTGPTCRTSWTKRK